MNTKHRRYSPNLLFKLVLWEKASSSLYKQIRGKGLLTMRYTKKLTSAFSEEIGFSENTIKYYEVRCQKLHNQKKIGSLTLDEIFIA